MKKMQPCMHNITFFLMEESVKNWRDDWLPFHSILRICNQCLQSFHNFFQICSAIIRHGVGQTKRKQHHYLRHTTTKQHHPCYLPTPQRNKQIWGRRVIIKGKGEEENRKNCRKLGKIGRIKALFCKLENYFSEIVNWGSGCLEKHANFGWKLKHTTTVGRHSWDPTWNQVGQNLFPKKLFLFGPWWSKTGWEFSIWVGHKLVSRAFACLYTKVMFVYKSEFFLVHFWTRPSGPIKSAPSLRPQQKFSYFKP